MSHDCRWFAITSADYWCFGAFQAGWKAAYASPPLPYLNRSPTILQVLILWTMSSLYENGPENPFVLSLRLLDHIRARQSYIEGVDGLVYETITYETYIRYIWKGALTEIDEGDSEEGTISSTGSGVMDGTPNNGSFVTQLGDEAHGELSSDIVVQDQLRPPPAEQSIFPQATLDSPSPRARGSHRFSPYPLPSSRVLQDSSRQPLNPVEESAGTSGNIAAGPSHRVDKGKGRAMDTAPTDLEEALPTIPRVLAQTVSALGSVLSLAFRTEPSATQNVRTVEKWRAKLTLSAEGMGLDGGTTAGPSGCGRSSGSPSTHPSDSGIPASVEPPRSGNSFLEHRSPVATDAPSSPVAGLSFIRQGDFISEEDEDFADAAE